jgi:hypothetical protein
MASTNTLSDKAIRAALKTNREGRRGFSVE